MQLSSSISALLLNFRYKKQENQAAILKRFSMDAAKSFIPFVPYIKAYPFI